METQQFPACSLRMCPASHGDPTVPCLFPKNVSSLPWGPNSSLFVPSECVQPPMGTQQFPACSLRMCPVSHGDPAVPCLFLQNVSSLPWGPNSSLFVPSECVQPPMGTQQFPACSFRMCPASHGDPAVPCLFLQNVSSLPWGPSSSLLVPSECVQPPMGTQQFPFCSFRMCPASHGDPAVPCLFLQNVSSLPWGPSSSLLVPSECVQPPMGPSMSYVLSSVVRTRRCLFENLLY